MQNSSGRSFDLLALYKAHDGIPYIPTASKEILEWVSTLRRQPARARSRRQRHPAAGDRAAFVVDEKSGARRRRREDDLEALQGIFPTPAGLSTDEFDNLVEEAMNDHADRDMRRMRATAD